MKSIALTESNIVDDGSYIMVPKDSIDIDDDSYVYCDDPSHALSIVHSTGFSLCSTNNLSEIVWDESTTIVSDDELEVGDEISINTSREVEKSNEVEILMPKFDSKPTDTVSNDVKSKSNDQNITTSNDKSKKVNIADDFSCENTTRKFSSPIVKSRMSNKKRRKKMKLMKKAAAAAAAAAALAEMKRDVTIPARIGDNNNRQSRKSKKKVYHANPAVAYASEAISDYQNKHNIKMKKFSAASNYICLL